MDFRRGKQEKGKPHKHVKITRFILRGNEGTIILATNYWHYDKITGIWTQTEDAKNTNRKMSL
jgi:hypothetical protein